MSLPDRDPLPRYVAPLPERLEDLGFRLLWFVVAANLAGTAFGFWYYRGQLGATDPAFWVLVPDSPAATLFIALSLSAWRLGRQNHVLDALAFFGCLKLGLWTPFVQLALNGPGDIATWLYWFLILSHLAMAVQAFLIHRYSAFPVWAVAVAAGWYWLNDVVDYFLRLGGRFNHTTLRAEWVAGAPDHTLAAHDLAAACAVTLTLLATFLALSTRVEKLSR